MTRSKKEPSAAIRGLLKQQVTTHQITEELVEINGNLCIRGYTPIGQRQVVDSSIRLEDLRAVSPVDLGTGGSTTEEILDVLLFDSEDPEGYDCWKKKAEKLRSSLEVKEGQSNDN
jgi:hypothetical protein